MPRWPRAVHSVRRRGSANHRHGEDETMPVYEYLCENCAREVTIPMTISQHDKGGATCPHCGGTALRPQVGTVFTQTSRKS